MLVLTETGVMEKDLAWVEGVFEGFKMYSVPASNARAKVEGGLIMLVRSGSNLQVEKVECDKKEGRWMSLKVALGGSHMAWVHGGYGVSGGGQKHKRKHAMGVVENWAGRVIECEAEEGLAGQIWVSDSNFLRDSHLDRAKNVEGRWRPADVQDHSESLYHRFLAESGMYDSWVGLHGDSRGHTRRGWSDVKGVASNKSRIDHIFLSGKFMEACTGVGVQQAGAVIESDHHMIVCEIDMRRVTGVTRNKFQHGPSTSEGGKQKINYRAATEENWANYHDYLLSWWQDGGQRIVEGQMQGGAVDLAEFLEGLMGEAAKHCMPAGHKMVVRTRGIRGVTPNKRVLHAINLVTGLQAQGRASNKARIKHIIKSLEGVEIGVREQEGGEWVTRAITVRRLGMSLVEFSSYCGRMRAGLERQVRHEGGEARRARAQAMGKSKSALFHENKKRWLGKTLGKVTRHMSIAHCWEIGADGIRVLQTSPAKVKASLDKHFHKWTKKPAGRLVRCQLYY